MFWFFRFVNASICDKAMKQNVNLFYGSRNKETTKDEEKGEGIKTCVGDLSSVVTSVAYTIAFSFLRLFGVNKVFNASKEAGEI